MAKKTNDKIGLLKFEEYGTNITAAMDGNTLVLRIDTSKTVGLSVSGKTTIVATTQGNKLVPGTTDMKIGVNVFKYAPRK